jgi:hypothetical protein
MRHLLIAPLFLAGCASAPATGALGVIQGHHWALESSTDRVTGETSISLNLGATIANYAGTVVRQGAVAASVLCNGGHPSVMFGFDFPVGIKGGAVLGYRFDEKPGQRLSPDFFNMETPLIRDKTQVANFLDQAKGSKKLYVRVISSAGIAEAEFNVSNGDESIKSFENQCHNKS